MKNTDHKCCDGAWSKYYRWWSFTFFVQRTRNYWGLGARLLFWPMLRLHLHVGPYTLTAGWPGIAGP